MSFLSQHRCVPIKTSGTVEETKKLHSFDRAGFDVITAYYEKSECPVCHRVYRVGDPVLIKHDFEPYGSTK